MSFLVSFVHIVVCLFLIIVVLLQSGKAADLAGAFGGMGSQTTFGPRGSATVLSRATTISAALFMVTSLTLTILATRGSGGAHSALPGAKPVSAPAKPAQPAAPNSVPLQIPQPTQPPQQQAPAPAKK
jgi:preprotein translocase subunit SecG